MRKFNKIYIEITNSCNLNCSFCSPTKRSNTFMSVDDFEMILLKIKDYTNIVYLHVKGEPLLHPNFEQLLTICEKNKMQVHITTNATLLKKQLPVIKNCKAIKKLYISLHCEHDNNDYFNDVFECVDNLSNIVVVYRIWTLKENEFDTHNSNIVILLCDKYPSVNMDTIVKQNNIKLAENIYLDKASEFIWPNLHNEIINTNGYCYALKTHIAVLSDGSVVPCCLDGEGIITLGNLKNNKLNEIIESDRFQSMRKGFQDRKPCEELCIRCGFHQR